MKPRPLAGRVKIEPTASAMLVRVLLLPMMMMMTIVAIGPSPAGIDDHCYIAGP
jgi:hypothetical protein